MDLNNDLKPNDSGESKGVSVETVQADVVESVEPIKPAVSAGADGGSNSAKPKKKNHTMALCMTLMAVAAVCAIGFGVWAMIDGEAQKKELNDQISSLKVQNSELLEESKSIEVDNSETTDLAIVNEHKNPIIVSNESGKTYSVMFDSASVGISNGDGGLHSIRIGIKDGMVDSCYESFANSNEGGVSGTCEIVGLTGKVYKVIEFGQGHDSAFDQIGFIMEDGTIPYFSLYDAIANGDYEVDGILKFDTPVVDALQINVAEGYTGYGSTVFVMSDGSYVKFDESMLNQ